MYIFYKSKILKKKKKINNYFDMKHSNVMIHVIPLIDFNMSVYIFVPSTDTWQVMIMKVVNQYMEVMLKL